LPSMLGGRDSSRTTCSCCSCSSTASANEYLDYRPTYGSWLIVDVSIEVLERREPGGMSFAYYEFSAHAL
jgi:hypothetical protein